MGGAHRVPAPVLPAIRTGGDRVTFPCFDGLRAIAAASIVVFHVAFVSGLGLRHPVLGLFLARLDVGVPLFFVISGFLLYRPFVAAHLAGRPHPRTRSFLARRVLRIVPAYWAVLAVVAFVLGLKHLGGIGGVAIYFGFLQIYDNAHIGGGISQAWSLCTEMTFYVALPAYAFAIRRIAGRVRARPIVTEWSGVAAVYAGGLATRALIAFGDLRAPFDCRLDWLPATMDLFALGMALAVASSSGAGRTWRASPRWCWTAAAVAYVAVSVGVFRTSDLGRAFTPLQVMGRQVLYGVVGLLVVAPGVFGPQEVGLARRWLRTRPMVSAGLVSYGIYLVHNAVIDEYLIHAHRRVLHAPVAPLLAVTVIGTAVAATVVHWVVERPALRFKRRYPDGAAVEVTPPVSADPR
ncbi:MAG: acyltransferase [Acidimicrobiales bacterium]